MTLFTQAFGSSLSVKVGFLFCFFLSGASSAGVYEIHIDSLRQGVEGRIRDGIGFNGQSPGPLLRWKEGEDVEIRVTNHLDRPSSIHWHGLILPYTMDGVPGISFEGIPPGSSFTYRFKVQQSGTYWYHGHSDFQEQEGLIGPIIIDPREAPDSPEIRDIPVVLSDWTDENPRRIYSKLKAQPDYYNFNRITVSGFMDQVRTKGFSAALSDSLGWGDMRMNQTDLADVTGYTYTYLINGGSASNPWIGRIKPDETVRLRLINASAMTYFDVRIPGLDLWVVGSDGQPIQPLRANSLRISVAETYDVIVHPKSGVAYPVFAESMDRSGYAMGVLTDNPKLKPVIPDPTPAKYPSLEDMMAYMGHSSHGKAGHEAHSSEGEKTQGSRELASGMMHHGHDMTLHGNPMKMGAIKGEIPPLASALSVDDYAPIKPAASRAPGSREFDRELKIRLTGNMSRYIWSMNDVVYEDAEPIRLKLGERIKITYINETMMNHPMHLHGMWQDLDNGDVGGFPRKHIISVKPGQTTSVFVEVDAPGAWAFHCHLVYHMASGMFRKVIVE